LAARVEIELMNGKLLIQLSYIQNMIMVLSCCWVWYCWNRLAHKISRYLRIY